MAKIPKVKIHANLQQVLLLILLLTLVLEGFVLYRAFYAAVDRADLGRLPAAETAPPVTLDLKEYDKVKTWIEKNRTYVLPSYELRTTIKTATTTIFYGRENPFAQ